MSNSKKYILTAITLGAITACSGALIGLSHLLTKNKIAQNEQNAINAGLRNIFGSEAELLSEEETSEYTYVNHIYVMKDSIGVAFKTTGSNLYGKISMIVGFTGSSASFSGMYIVVNEQTYASTLVDNYINPVNNGQREIDDVQCGATYGAKLIKGMIDEAQSVARKMNME